MFNPFRIFTLASDARRADELLEGEFPHSGGLVTKARYAVLALNGLGADNRHLDAKLRATENRLAAANAKIERMTSGLRRGSKKAA